MSGGSSAAIDRLSPQQIEARLARASVAYLPLGSLEHHGPHLPIGLDALTASGICLAAADRSGGVVLPAMHQAVGGEHTRYPWTVMSRSAESIEMLLAETLERMNELGIQRFVILSGHFVDEQRDLVKRVANSWNATAVSARAIARPLGGPQIPRSRPTMRPASKHSCCRRFIQSSWMCASFPTRTPLRCRPTRTLSAPIATAAIIRCMECSAPTLGASTRTKRRLYSVTWSNG